MGSIHRGQPGLSCGNTVRWQQWHHQRSVVLSSSSTEPRPRRSPPRLSSLSLRGWGRRHPVRGGRCPHCCSTRATPSTMMPLRMGARLRWAPADLLLAHHYQPSPSKPSQGCRVFTAECSKLSGGQHTTPSPHCTNLTHPSELQQQVLQMFLKGMNNVPYTDHSCAWSAKGGRET